MNKPQLLSKKNGHPSSLLKGSELSIRKQTPDFISNLSDQKSRDFISAKIAKETQVLPLALLESNLSKRLVVISGSNVSREELKFICGVDVSLSLIHI